MRGAWWFIPPILTTYAAQRVQAGTQLRVLLPEQQAIDTGFADYSAAFRLDHSTTEDQTVADCVFWFMREQLKVSLVKLESTSLNKTGSSYTATTVLIFLRGQDRLGQQHPLKEIRQRTRPLFHQCFQH